MFDIILSKFCKLMECLFTYKFLISKVNRKLKDTYYVKILLKEKSSNLS